MRPFGLRSEPGPEVDREPAVPERIDHGAEVPAAAIRDLDTPGAVVSPDRADAEDRRTGDDLDAGRGGKGGREPVGHPLGFD